MCFSAIATIAWLPKLANPLFSKKLVRRSFHAHLENVMTILREGLQSDSYFPIVFPVAWGRSSAGRALDWQSRGQGFDPPRLHHCILRPRFCGVFFFVSDDCTLKPGRIRSGQTRWMRALGEQDDMAIAACRERYHACTGPPCKDMRLRPLTVLWKTYMPNYAIRARNSFLIA